MQFRESGDQDNDHEGKCEEVVTKIMISKEIRRNSDQDNGHELFS